MTAHGLVMRLFWNELKKHCNTGRHVLVADVYPGVFDDEILPELMKLHPALVINMIDLFKEEKTISEQLKYHITDDRVFGKMYYGDVIDFIDLTKLEEAKQPRLWHVMVWFCFMVLELLWYIQGILWFISIWLAGKFKCVIAQAWAIINAAIMMKIHCVKINVASLLNGVLRISIKHLYLNEWTMYAIQIKRWSQR